MNKNLILTLLFVFSIIDTKAQNGIVLLTEKFTISAPFTSVVIVSYADGTSTSTNITPEATNIVQHDIDLTKIINTITSKGYKLITAPEGWGFAGYSSTAMLRRMFFGIP